jgi:2-oxoglutarate dehydrogenase E2 component (dihydrolipoamide succinyltransferase)
MSIELRIPHAGESVQEMQIGQWLKQEGDRVRRDETLVELDTDKASMELPAPSDGILSRIVKHDGDKVAVGEVIALIDPDGQSAPKSDARSQTAAEPSKQKQKEENRGRQQAPSGPGPVPKPSPPTKSPKAEPKADTARAGDEAIAAPSVRRLLRERHVRAQDVKPSGEGGRLLREDVLKYAEEQAAEDKQSESEEARSPEESGKETALKPEAPRAPKSLPAAVPPSEAQSPQHPPDHAMTPGAMTPAAGIDRSDNVVPMSLVRRRIAERLVEARQKAALLTTFNEIDMTAVIALRTHYREMFQQNYGVKLGFASFFVHASTEALRQFPVVNAEIRGTDIVYHNAYHIGVAIGAERGLVVPVIRDADLLSIAQIEQAIGDFSTRAKSNKLQPDELAGGTFTISNGGIFGSLLSTPIVNLPQSAVLGMHAIQERPVAREGQVVIRPMMYVALSYDHRLIDGREAVSFLARVKQIIEDPARSLLGV